MLEHVRMVEIEIHAYCNRACSWCPNSSIGRNEKIEMDEQTYRRVLIDLRDNNFKGTLSYSRYNEPMSMPKLLKERTRVAKEILPNVKLVTNTNGDYLKRENLEGLSIDELSVMDYDCRGMEKCKERMIQAGIAIKREEENFLYGMFGEMVVLYYIDWPKHIQLEDRGGFLPKEVEYFNRHEKKYVKMGWRKNREERKSPCLEPTYFIAIDYNGNVNPCCHIRSDIPQHKELSLGNVNETGIADIYYNEKATVLREVMANGEIEKYPSPCQFCQKCPGRYTRDEPGIDYK